MSILRATRRVARELGLDHASLERRDAAPPSG
jgi:hypothetical protein